MIIKDIFLLEKSEEFKLSCREEVTVNLRLKEVPTEPRTTIKGKVIDKDNNPIKDATVKIFTLKYRPVEHVTTDECGEFSFKNIILPGTYYLIATASCYKVSKSCRLIVRENFTNRITIQLIKDIKLNLGTLYGILRDEDGKGIYNAVIKVFSIDNIEKVIALAHTNMDGEYIIYGLKAGSYLINASKRGYDFLGEVSFIIKEREFSNVDLIMCKCLNYGKGTISGRIMFNGQKVPNALVALYSLNEDRSKLIKIKVCNDDGVYLIEGIEPGKYIVKSNKEEKIIDIKEGINKI